jgi:hypothetical protein
MLAHRVLLVRLGLEQAAFFDVGRRMDVTAAYRGETRNNANQKQATGEALQALAIAIHGASPFTGVSGLLFVGSSWRRSRAGDNPWTGSSAAR